jgi:hypothetical protein
VSAFRARRNDRSNPALCRDGRATVRRHGGGVVRRFTLKLLAFCWFLGPDRVENPRMRVAKDSRRAKEIYDF